MASNLPVVQAARAVALESPHLAIEGLEGLTQRDVIIPRWSLIQPTSRKEGADEHVGQFKRNIDGEFRPHLDVVILKIDATRLKWPANSNEGRPECFSRDAVHGSLYGTCATCQYNLWANPALGAALKNGEDVEICSYGYTAVVVDDLEAETPALVGAMGTSVQPTRTLISTFARKRRSPFSAIVRIGSDRVTNDRGKFYVMTYTPQKWLDERETARWREMFLAFKGAAVKDIEDDETFGDAPRPKVVDENPLNARDEEDSDLPF